MILKLSCAGANPQTVDLSSFVYVDDGGGLDFANPAFTQRVFSRSLLKPGATLSLTSYVERELTIPLKIGPTGATGAPTSLTQTLALIEQVNQILETPGAVLTWQPDGASQPTYFDCLIGQLEIGYRFRAEQQKWTMGNLRFFAQPFGRTAGPRPYASASGVGPLLMITPYASSGGNPIIGQSTQAGVLGWGAGPGGLGGGPGGVPSSGVFYWGSPSLAGDAPAQLQISYAGPFGASVPTVDGRVPYAAVAVLPDENYHPLFTIPSPPFTSVGVIQLSGNPSIVANAQAVASTYLYTGPVAPSTTLGILPNISAGGSVIPPQSWAGQHRLFAIARASSQPGAISGIANSLISTPVTATVYPGDWSLYDIGTCSLRPSEVPGDYVMIGVGGAGGGFSGNVDITAVAMLPDNATWFLNPTGTRAVRSIAPGGGLWIGLGNSMFTNTLVLDDVLGDQFIYTVGSSPTAPSPAGAVEGSVRITQYSRGLVPQPDPKNGLPIIAILGVGQAYAASTAIHGSQSWQNPQNMLTSAQVSAVERARYVLP